MTDNETFIENLENDLEDYLSATQPEGWCLILPQDAEAEIALAYYMVD